MDPNYTTEELLKLYGTDVLRFIRFYTKNDNEAEDLTQEVFLRVHKNRETFRNGCSAKTWLFQIAVNVCRNYHRSLTRRPQVLVDTVPCTEMSPSAESEVIQNNEDDELIHLIQDLPITLKEVIVLYYFEEKSTAEIAQLLGVSSSTVKIRLFRARNALKRGKECLQNAGEFKHSRPFARVETSS